MIYKMTSYIFVAVCLFQNVAAWSAETCVAKLAWLEENPDSQATNKCSKWKKQIAECGFKYVLDDEDGSLTPCKVKRSRKTGRYKCVKNRKQTIECSEDESPSIPIVVGLPPIPDISEPVVVGLPPISEPSEPVVVLPKPACMCPKILRPVCDEATGTTFNNSCEAACKGAVSTVNGACSPVPVLVGLPPIVVEPPQPVILPEPACMCPKILRPVCDEATGTTFNNSCEAACKGAVSTVNGACSPVPVLVGLPPVVVEPPQPVSVDMVHPQPVVVTAPAPW